MRSSDKFALWIERAHVRNCLRVTKNGFDMGSKSCLPLIVQETTPQYDRNHENTKLLARKVTTKVL